MSIILIGYRGSGKTTVGRLLAERLKWPFVDADERIVAAAGQSIKEIFETGGEARFRELESAALQEIVTLKNHVLSLGGGAILAQQNRDSIAGSGHTIVYLHADPAELHRRIHADTATAANRPALTKLGGGIDEIRSVLAAREPIYRQVMTAEIDVTRKSPKDVVEEIVKRVDVRPIK
jgi:shikimate kinase